MWPFILYIFTTGNIEEIGIVDNHIPGFSYLLASTVMVLGQILPIQKKERYRIDTRAGPPNLYKTILMMLSISIIPLSVLVIQPICYLMEPVIALTLTLMPLWVTLLIYWYSVMMGKLTIILSWMTLLIFSPVSSICWNYIVEDVIKFQAKLYHCIYRQ